MKKLLSAASVLLVLSASLEAKVEKLVVSGPFASVSHPILHMIETNALKDVADKLEFKVWKNPDELRAMTIKNSVDFIAVPTNTAATLHN